jgi:hypothetical protein
MEDEDEAYDTYLYYYEDQEAYDVYYNQNEDEYLEDIQLYQGEAVAEEEAPQELGEASLMVMPTSATSTAVERCGSLLCPAGSIQWLPLT